MKQRHSPGTKGCHGDHGAWRDSERLLTADLAKLKNARCTVGPATLSHALHVYSSLTHATQALSTLRAIEEQRTPTLQHYKYVLSAACNAAGTIQGDSEMFQKVYKELRTAGLQPDTELHRLFLRHIRKSGEKELVGKTVDVLLKDGVIFTAGMMNEVLATCSTVDEALNVFHRFQKIGVAPNSNTFCCILKVCREAADVTTAEQLMSLRKICDPSEWDALMRVHRTVSGLEGVLGVLTRMEAAKVEPQMSTHSIVLAACADAKQQKTAEQYFRKMMTLGHVKSKAAIGSMMAVFAATRDARQAEQLLQWSDLQGIPPSEVTLRYHEEATRKEGVEEEKDDPDI